MFCFSCVCLCVCVYFLHLTIYKIKYIFTGKIRSYFSWSMIRLLGRKAVQSENTHTRWRKTKWLNFIFSFQDMRGNFLKKKMLQISRGIKHLLFIKYAIYKNFQKESLILAFWNNGNPWKLQFCGFIKCCSLSLSASKEKDLNVSPSLRLMKGEWH